MIPRDANGHRLRRHPAGRRRCADLRPTPARIRGAAFCVLYGSHIRSVRAKIAELYPTHEAYVQAVRRVTNQEREGGLRPGGGRGEIIRDARTSRVGTPNPLPIP